MTNIYVFRDITIIYSSIQKYLTLLTDVSFIFL